MSLGHAVAKLRLCALLHKAQLDHAGRKIRLTLSVRGAAPPGSTVVERIPDSRCRLSSGGALCGQMVSNGSKTVGYCVKTSGTRFRSLTRGLQHWMARRSRLVF